MAVYNAKLSGVRMGREPQKNLIIVADNGVLRLHVQNEAGTSLASIALDEDQTLLLGAWLIGVVNDEAGADPMSTVLPSGRFAATVR